MPIPRLIKAIEKSKSLEELSWLVGQELDYIEKRMETGQELASSVVVFGSVGPIVEGDGGGTGTGIIAWGQQTLVAGDNVVSFAQPLSSDQYGVIPVLYADGALIEFDPSRPTAKTTAGFHYHSPQAATLFYFAMVAT